MTDSILSILFYSLRWMNCISEINLSSIVLSFLVIKESLLCIPNNQIVFLTWMKIARMIRTRIESLRLTDCFKNRLMRDESIIDRILFITSWIKGWRIWINQWWRRNEHCDQKNTKWSENDREWEWIQNSKQHKRIEETELLVLNEVNNWMSILEWILSLWTMVDW